MIKIIWRWVYSVGIAIGIFWLGLNILGPMLGNKTQVTNMLPVDCYVGVKGTAATVTVSGLAAGMTCDAIVSSSNGKMYRLSQAPREPAVCEQTVNGQRFLVRDTGVLKVIGNVLCSEIGQRARASP